MRRVFCLALLVGFSGLAASAADHAEAYFAAFKVFSDRPDRVWVAVDRTGDGSPDEAVAYTSRHSSLPAEVLAELPRTVRSGRVTTTGERLAFEEWQGRQPLWRLTIAVDPDGGEEIATAFRDAAQVGVTLANGAALTRHETLPSKEGQEGPERLTFDDVERVWAPGLETVVRQAPWSDGEIGDCGSCDSGGRGASSCSSGCEAQGNLGVSGPGAGGQAGAGTSASCSVSCGAGYFACCNCSFEPLRVWLVTIRIARSECTCVSSGCRD